MAAGKTRSHSTKNAKTKTTVGKSQVRNPKSKGTRAAKPKRNPEIKLDNWTELEKTIRGRLGKGGLVVRNFQRVVFEHIGTADEVEIDRLKVARKTGLDRRENALRWNATGFDHDREQHRMGKRPDEIMHAFWVSFRLTSYKASRAQGENRATLEPHDITEGLTEHDAIIVYDPRAS